MYKYTHKSNILCLSKVSHHDVKEVFFFFSHLTKNINFVSIFSVLCVVFTVMFNVHVSKSKRKEEQNYWTLYESLLLASLDIICEKVGCENRILGVVYILMCGGNPFIWCIRFLLFRECFIEVGCYFAFKNFFVIIEFRREIL